MQATGPSWVRAFARSCRVPLAAAVGGSVGKALGCGAFGCVLPKQGDPDTVVKITSDETEAALAKKLLAWRRSRPRAYPGIVDVTSVHEAKNGQRTRAYAIVREAVSPAWRQSRWWIPSGILARFPASDVVRGLEALEAATVASRYRPASLLALARGRPWLETVVRTLAELEKKEGIQLVDTHRGNVGWTRVSHLGRAPDSLVVFDFGAASGGPQRARGLDRIACS